MFVVSKPSRVFTVLLALTMSATDGVAATRTAASCNQSDVQNAVGAASAGDIVQIPGGTCTWNTMVTIAKGITLQGAGIDVTVIRDNVPKDGSSGSRLLMITVNSPAAVRVTGLTIEGVAPDSSKFNHGHIYAYGTSKAFRIDHIKFKNLQTVGIRIDGDHWGVVDHNEFNGSFNQGVLISHSAWGGGSYGDGSWAAPTSLGTEQAIYVEDNIFRDSANPYAGAGIDAFDGARIVVRHNRFEDQFIASHGTESSARRRGLRSFEIYNNTLSYNGSYFTAIFIRGGTGVVFNNTASGYTTFLRVVNFRDDAPYVPWGKCDGSSPYDQNTSGQSGYRCMDQPGAGVSRLMSGDTPSAQPVNNALEPVYHWGNTYEGPYMLSLGSGHIQAGRDVVDAAKPGYVPFKYPHPLTTGAITNPPSTSLPSSPTNVRIIR